jgi:hypothetical protein
MNSDCRMEQTDSCDTSFANTDSNCSASISFEDIHALTSRLSCASCVPAQMTWLNQGVLPTLELDQCFEETDQGCGSGREPNSASAMYRTNCELICEPNSGQL